MKRRIIDKRNKQKFQVDDAYLNGYAKHCGINATGVYMVLCRHVDSQNQECFPSKKLMADKLGISERSVYTGIKRLEEFNIIMVKKQGRKEDGSFKNLTYILLDKTEWIPLANVAVGKKQQHPSANIAINRRQILPNKDTHINQGYTYKHKETHMYREIFNFWNKQQLITHRKFDSYKQSISGAFNNYTLREIKQAIRNYAKIVNGEKYFFTYKWTISDFLQRKNGIERFLPENFEENHYKGKSNLSKQKEGVGKWMPKKNKK